MNEAEADKQIETIMRAAFAHLDGVLTSNGQPALGAEFVPGGMVLIPSSTDGAMTFDDSRIWLDGYLACLKRQELTKGKR